MKENDTYSSNSCSDDPEKPKNDEGDDLSKKCSDKTKLETLEHSNNAISLSVSPLPKTHRQKLTRKCTRPL